MNAARRPNLINDAAVRNYTLACLIALLIMTLVQMGQRYDLLSLLPILAGVLGLLLRSSLGSLMLLFALGGQQFIYQQGWIPGTVPWRAPLSGPRFRPADVILCIAVLAYVVAHYRLLGLVKNLFPLEPAFRDERPRQGWWAGTGLEARRRRSTRLVGPLEWGLLLLSLPAFAVLAQLLWLLLPNPWLPFDIPSWFVRWTVLIVPFWVVGTLLIVIAGVLGYWGRRSMTVMEGRLLLQDKLWHETRREQRWINRWLAWDRLRRAREEDKS